MIAVVCRTMRDFKDWVNQNPEYAGAYRHAGRSEKAVAITNANHLRGISFSDLIVVGYPRNNTAELLQAMDLVRANIQQNLVKTINTRFPTLHTETQTNLYPFVVNLKKYFPNHKVSIVLQERQTNQIQGFCGEDPETLILALIELCNASKPQTVLD